MNRQFPHRTSQPKSPCHLVPVILAFSLIALIAACSIGPPSASSRTTAALSAAATTYIQLGHRSAIPAIGAQLIGAGHIAFDPAGTLYFSECDWVHAAIHRLNADGSMSTYAGTGVPGFAGDGGPATQAQLYCAAGLSFGPDGALYVDDHVNNRIRRIDAAGIITTVVGSGPAGLDLGSWSGDGGPATHATLQEPVEIVFDATGDLYISDRDNNRIRKVDALGIISTIGGNGKTGYEGDGVAGNQTSVEFPLGIALDPKGNVVFADEGNKRIRMIDHLTGIITTIAGNGVNATSGDGGPATAASIGDPGGLFFDTAGNLYLVGTGAPAFRRIDAHGRISSVTTIGSISIPPDLISTMNGEVFDATGNLYGTTGTGVFRLDINGAVTLLAGVR